MIKYYNLIKPWSRWLFLLMFLFSLQSKALTQDSVQVSINAVNKPIEVVFKQIESQTGYTVFYGRPTLNGDELVTIQSRTTLSNILNTLLKGRNIAWAIKDKSIILTKRNVVSENGNNLDTVPKVNISGSIVDKSGIPIVGATVSLRGQAKGQATDNLGQFRIVNIPISTTLVVSSVGYRSKQFRLGGETELRIELDSAITDIQKIEVVSTGYQIIAKERVTGSFFTIDNDLFNRRIGATVMERIQDLVPGVIYNKDRGPNPLDNFTIRGISTINANKQPLLVVDNFIYDGDPNSLNPNDVESITILRDAAAASIWGVRAGNGVIVITMKKGRFTNKPLISLNTNFTFGQKPDLFDLPIVRSKDVVELERKRFNSGYYNGTLNNTSTYPLLSQVVEILAQKRAGSIAPEVADAQISILENHDIRNDIKKRLLQTAIAQQYALNISGGGTNYQYYGSVGYDRNRPNNINVSNERLTIRFNNNWNPVKNLHIKAEMNWGQSDAYINNSLGAANYNTILNTPYDRIIDEEGRSLAIPRKYRKRYVDTVRFPGQLDWHYVPMDESNNGNTHRRGNDTRLNFGVNYVIIPGLKAEVNYQWQKFTSDIKVINSLATFTTRDLINRLTNINSSGLPDYPYPLGGVYSRSNSDGRSWNLRGVLVYDKNFRLHDVSILAGLENRESSSEGWSMPTQYGYSPQTFTFGALKFGNWVARPARNTETISPSTASISGAINRFGSYFGNGSYTYMGKYSISGSARVDQSNFFGVSANDRKVPLWSVGTAWAISKEEFYKIYWLPNLKLRVTFGYNGNVNAGTSPFATAQYFNPANPIFVPYADLVTSPNPQLRWERVQNINFGLDFGSKDQRISGNLEFFRKKGIDLISKIDVDPTSGFSAYTGNNSSVQTQGLDFSLTSRNFDGNFKWYTTVIFAYQKDKVISYSVKPPSFAVISGVIVGKPLNNIYSYRWAGLNPINGDSRFYIKKDIVGSSSISSVKQEDLFFSGQTNPPVFGSLRNDLSFRNISLSFNISYQFGYYFRRVSFSGGFGSTSGVNLWQHEDYLKAWKLPGDEKTTNVPGFLDSYTDSRYEIYRNSDILMEKGDHIRLQDIRIDYKVDRARIRKLPFSRGSLYLYATNIGFLWKASLYNPDTNGDILTVPRQKTIAMGINMNF